jgi:hypothetical protein
MESSPNQVPALLLAALSVLAVLAALQLRGRYLLAHSQDGNPSPTTLERQSLYEMDPRHTGSAGWPYY